jgi:excisionase family DNA binding protein
MAKESKNKPPPEPPQEVSLLLREELHRRGMSEAEIDAVLRKKKRRKVLEFNAVHYRLHRMDPSPSRTSPSELMTVEAAAEQLKLHPKTILRFIHEGRLKATRVGKSYRIVRADLDAFSGVPERAEAPVEAWVTSIVDIPGCSPELAETLARQVPSALNSKPEGAPMRAEVVYEAERPYLKIVLTGGPSATANMLSLIRVWLEQAAR